MSSNQLGLIFPILIVEGTDKGTSIGLVGEKNLYKASRLGLKDISVLKYSLFVDFSGKTCSIKGIKKKKMIWSIIDLIDFNPMYEIEYVLDGEPYVMSFQELRSKALEYPNGGDYVGGKTRARKLVKRLEGACTIADIFKIFEDES